MGVKPETSGTLEFTGLRFLIAKPGHFPSAQLFAQVHCSLPPTFKALQAPLDYK